MMPSHMDLDTESDTWIATYLSVSADKGERNTAAQRLFHKHKVKVFSQIRKKIQHGDAQNDISQEVWMNILNVDRLRDKYVAQGKFGAYLYQYTEWKIYDFLRKNVNSANEEYSLSDQHDYADTASSHEATLDARRLVIDVIPELSAAVRLVYLMEYYETLFPSKPAIRDIAHLNGVEIEAASNIISRCTKMDSSDMSEVDRCLWILNDYDNIVPKSVKYKVSGYKADLARIVGISYSSYRVRLSRANDAVKNKIESLVESEGAVA